MADLQPLKISLVTDLVELINENLGDLLRTSVACCTDCGGRGTIGGEAVYEGGRGGKLNGSRIVDDGTLATCATCQGVGAVERYTLDNEKIRTRRFGRLIEGFDLKHGQLVPRFRSKDKAFAQLTKLLGFDKAVLEIANSASFAETLSDEQRSEYVSQLKEMAHMGLLDAG